LIDDIFDEALLRRKIEDVVFVDPGRHHQQWPLADFLCCRRILNELQQFILKDDLARRGGEVAAKLEGGGVGLADLHQIARVLEILGEKIGAVQKITAVRDDRFAQDLRVGREEIRRRIGARVLAKIELGAVTLSRVEAGRGRKLVLGPLAGEQVSLLAKIEEGVVVPLRVVEAVVPRPGLDQRRNFQSHRTGQDIVPEAPELAEEMSLGLRQFDGIGKPRPKQGGQRLGGG